MCSTIEGRDGSCSQGLLINSLPSWVSLDQDLPASGR
jgi:hypothetical protein